MHNDVKVCKLSCEMTFADDCTVRSEVEVSCQDAVLLVSGTVPCNQGTFHHHCVKDCFNQMMNQALSHFDPGHHAGEDHVC